MKKILVSALLGALCISSFSTLTVKADVLTGGEEIVSEVIGDGEKLELSEEDIQKSEEKLKLAEEFMANNNARGVVW